MKKHIWKWIACITAIVALVMPAAAQPTNVGGTNNIVTLTNAANAVVATTNAVTNAAGQTAARTTSRGDGGYLGLIIWGAVIAAVFVFLWSKGYLVKIRNYVDETQEELKKCSWPSREELKGSTVVVMVTLTLLGLFTVGVDWVLSSLIRLIT